MKAFLAAAAVCGLLIAGASAHGWQETRVPEAPAQEPTRLPDFAEWTRPLAPGSVRVEAAAAVPSAVAAAAEIDVVDAHWMALTMWGEARDQGEEGMRAVGHVIRNRWETGRGGAYVTGTVSEAFQFSCWNEGDPNRAAMLDIENLPKTGRDYRLWQAAKQLAAEILAGGSADPTDGALFYHTTAVQPRWSAGVAPIKQIGDHLFFGTAR